MKTLLELGFFKLILAWYDMWIGLYWDVGYRTLYICPLPMIVLRFQFPGPKNEAKHRLDRETVK